MSFVNKYPYTDFHELNLDWFLQEFNKVMDEWAEMQQNFDSLDELVHEFTDFVTNYFDNLDVQQEINNKLNALVEDGTLKNLLEPYFDELVADVNHNLQQQNANIVVLESRMDEFSTLTDGSTTGDAELADIRIGANGYTYPNAGDAVRGQVENLTNEDPSEVPIGKNLFNYTFYATAGYINTSGSFVANASYVCAAPVWIRAGKYAFCVRTTNLSANAAAVNITNSDGSTVYDTILATDMNTHIHPFNRDLEWFKFTMTNDGYVMFNCGSSSDAKGSMLVKIVADADVPSVLLDYYGISKIKEGVNFSNGQKEYLKDIISATDFTDLVNCFDGTYDPTEGYYANLAFTPAAGYHVTTPIYLVPGKYAVTIPGNVNNNQAARVLKDGTLTYVFGGTLGDSITLFGAVYKWLTFETVNEGYYSFNAGPYTMVLKYEDADDLPSSFLSYRPAWQVKEDIYPNNLMRSLSDNPLTGKKISLNGDSICYGAGFVGGYGRIIADENNMEYQNIAVGGGTIASGTVSGDVPRHHVCETISNMDSDADYAIFEGGVNDASLPSQVSLGTISEGYDAVLDTTTFYGAMESCCKQMTTRFAGKKIGYIAVHKMTDKFNSDITTNSFYYAALEVCAKWGVPVCDLNIDCPPFGYFTTAKCTDADLNALAATYTDSGDGWHPSEDGYKKYYVDKITAWLKSL